jgi:hypothetical protein
MTENQHRILHDLIKHNQPLLVHRYILDHNLAKGPHVYARDLPFPVEQAVLEANSAMIRLLSNHRFDLNQSSTGVPPIHSAILRDEPDIALALQHGGADTDVQYRGVSVVEQAYRHGYTELAKTLQAHGASLDSGKHVDIQSPYELALLRLSWQAGNILPHCSEPQRCVLASAYLAHADEGEREHYLSNLIRQRYVKSVQTIVTSGLRVTNRFERQFEKLATSLNRLKRKQSGILRTRQIKQAVTDPKKLDRWLKNAEFTR